jgi:hypothetical protein
MGDLTNSPQGSIGNYTVCKIGNWFLAVDMTWNAGMMRVGLSAWHRTSEATNPQPLRNTRVMKLLPWPLLQSHFLTAHAPLYAGFSLDLGLENHGVSYVIP